MCIGLFTNTTYSNLARFRHLKVDLIVIHGDLMFVFVDMMKRHKMGFHNFQKVSMEKLVAMVTDTYGKHHKCVLKSLFSQTTNIYL